MIKQKKPLFSDEYLTSLAQEINEQFGDAEQVLEDNDFEITEEVEDN